MHENCMYDNAILKIIFRRELFSSRTYFKEKKTWFFPVPS